MTTRIRPTAVVIAAAVAAVATANSLASGETVYAYDNLAESRGGVGDALIVFDSDDPATVTEIGRSGFMHTVMTGLEFTPDGKLWSYGAPLTASGQAGFYSVNPDTGAATFIGAGGVEGDRRITDLAYNPGDGVLYATAHRLGVVPQLYTIDTQTGFATLVGDLVSDDTVVPYGLAADSAGVLYIMGAVVGSADGLFRLEGLELKPQFDLPIEILYSQGITIDWSGASGEQDLGLHGAHNSANLHTELYRFTTDADAAVYVGDIGPTQPSGTALHETGDVAIRPMPRRTLRHAKPEPR